MSEGFGTANYDGNRSYFKRWKLEQPKEEGQETRKTFRLIPPLKSYRESGQWFQYYGTHFGYAGVNARDAGKPVMRTFGCIFKDNYKTKMVIQACAECEVIEEKTELYEHRKEEYERAGKTPSEVKQLLEPLSAWKQKHNCDRKYHINAMLPDGSAFGVLAITGKCKKKLETRMAEARKKGIDPLAPDQGVLFEFVRTGRGFNVDDDVFIVQETKIVDGEELQKVKRAPMTEKQIKDALEICPDLSPGAGQVVSFITADQIKQLVACSGAPEEVDAIWAQGQKTQRERSPLTERESAGKQTESVEDRLARIEKARAAAQAALEAKAAAEAAAQAAAAAAATEEPEEQEAEASTPSTPSVDDPSELSDEEFFAKFSKK